ncbi:MAG: NAD-dependent dehydratase [Xanthomonadales bacterium]|nr:NAD-dependent dehydratase [Gammaproteobacteria bacterium]NNE05635.1 NAD-dependent dehydratase [Xanthomonadales bacterium]NNL95564.1 NAD-dependent dehydratase [Xanthomonadales bacterium]
MSKPTVLLPGASGQIGIFAIPLLVASGFDVLAISRHDKPAWYPGFEGVDWIMPADVSEQHYLSASHLLSCGPLKLAGVLVKRSRGLRRVVAFSTSSVFSKQASGDRREREQIRDIISEERVLVRRCAEQGIALSIFRPTLVYGCGLDQNISMLARWIERFGFVPISRGASGLRQPVHAQDLARAAVKALEHEPALALDSPLCGGCTISYHDMVSGVFNALGRAPRFVHLPERLMVGLTYLFQPIPGLGAVRPEMIRRQARDLVFDDSTAREALDYSPRPFSPSKADFSLPTRAKLKALAKRSVKS